MSQHHYRTIHRGVPTLVQMGWDRPLSYVYLVVTQEGDDIEEPTLYCNLDQPDPDALTLQDFRAALAALDLAVPETMFEQTEQDRLHNVGNRHCIHTDQGFSN